jgi:hypothetical protein
MLVRLLYASRAQAPLTQDVIAGILDQSRRNNPQNGVTGVLCICQDRIFIQVLEGGRVEVNELFSKVIQDDRHKDVTLLDYMEIQERRFSGWRMGRIDLDKVNAAVVLKYSEKSSLDPFSISGKSAMKLLEELASTASIMGGT